VLQSCSSERLQRSPVTAKLSKGLSGAEVEHSYYSQREGLNPNAKGLPLADVIELFVRVFAQLQRDGYFHEAFGYQCVDAGHIEGKIADIELEMLLSIRKKKLWPIEKAATTFSEDDFFDVLEFLFQHVSKPIEGNQHDWNGCGMHWETFNQSEGRAAFRAKANGVLELYARPFELSAAGEVLRKAEVGFEPIFDADVPSRDTNVVSRLSASVLRYRRHGSTLDDRRHAVRDLADVLEYLRPRVKTLLTTNDERDLFKIANNFGIRHLNDQQKTNYDSALWLSWMFYYYLATIHVVLRKIDHDDGLSGQKHR